jgi:hypothetical protein
MTRPKILHVGGTLYWVIRTRNPDSMVLKDADSTPTVAVRKNGASVGDSVTVTKRSATTGIYDCSYNPAGEVEGDEFTIEESATVTGTTTGSATYANSWEFTILALERGTDSGATSAQALDIQSRIPDALEGGRIKASVSGTGTGARTVTITVNDGTNALQNAKVRVTQGAESYLGTTNVSGVVTFNLDDATWTIAITKPGYTYSGTTLIVDGNESATYSMTAVTITPSSGSLVTGYWVCYSELGVVESGVSITMQATKVPADTGFALDSAIRTATSGSDGVAQFTNLIPGATYRVQRNSGDYYTIKIADTATGSVELNSILGT